MTPFSNKKGLNIRKNKMYYSDKMVNSTTIKVIFTLAAFTIVMLSGFVSARYYCDPWIGGCGGGGGNTNSTGGSNAGLNTISNSPTSNGIHIMAIHVNYGH